MTDQIQGSYGAPGMPGLDGRPGQNGLLGIRGDDATVPKIFLRGDPGYDGYK